MTRAPITRRALMVASGAALGAVALPAGISRALAAAVPPIAATGAAPAMFDAAAFVADVRAAGLGIFASREPSGPDWSVGRAAYCIGPGALGAFNSRGHLAVMRRWSDAMDACPDHVERVTAYLAQAGA